MAYRKVPAIIENKFRGSAPVPENKPTEIKKRGRGRPPKNKINVEKPKAPILNEFSSIISKKIDESFKEALNPQLDLKSELEEIDSLDFKRGENILSIKLFKKENRVFRIQMFLNKTTEIRNVTYSGTNTAFGFWNLLKGSLK